MKKTTVLTLTLCLASTMLLAQRGPRGPRGDGERGRPSFEALKTAIGITDEQIDQISELRRTNREAAREAMEGTREKVQQLREEMQQENPNAPLVGQLTVELQQARRDAKAAQEALREEIRGLLTPEQADKLAELEAARALLPAIGQAGALGLTDGPGGDRFGGPGRGFGRRGPGGPGGPGGPPQGAGFGFRGPRGE